MLRPCLTASLVCLLAAASAARADMSYSYLDGGLAVTRTDIETLGEQDGLAGDFVFSYELFSFLYVFGGYEYYEIDDTSLDGELFNAGAGVHFDPSDTTSIFFNLAALRFEADVISSLGTVRIDEDGDGYTFGYREANASGRMEFLLSVEHQEFDDADDTWINMGLEFRVTPRFKISGRVSFAGDENVARIGVRYYLPTPFDRPRD